MWNPFFSQDILACADTENSQLSLTLPASILPPLNSSKIISLGGEEESVGYLSSIQPTSSGKPGWAQATESQLSQAPEVDREHPARAHLLGATHCTPLQWLLESKGLFPTRRSCMWNAQQTHRTQADYNYKLKGKIKVPSLWFAFLAVNCQWHGKLHFCFFPYVAFTEGFTLNQKTNMEKNIPTEFCL